MTQISIWFVFSTWVTPSWGTGTATLIVSYLYTIIRLLSKFDNLPENLFIAIIETIFFHAFGSFLFSRTLKMEFLANYKNKKSSKEFREFLDTLPEGVTIVDDQTSEFKFVNSKFKETLNMHAYQEAGNDSLLLQNMQQQINEEFDQLMKKFKEKEGERESTANEFKKILKPFKVRRQSEDDDQNRIDQFDLGDDQVAGERHFVRAIHDKPDISLKCFLENERKIMELKNSNSRSTKIYMFWDIQEEHKGEEIEETPIKRNFIVKTKKIDITDDLSDHKTLFMHMFIDTTKISQLEEAKAQNRYQRQMLANVSHEFRTPLNAMMMSLCLLKDSINPWNQKFLKIANSSWNILAALVEDILDHAKIDIGVFEIHETEFKMADLFEEVHNIFELQAQSKKIDLSFSICDKLKSVQVRTDKQRLKQILLNLISNSMKFTDKGFIKVTVQEETDIIELQNGMIDEDEAISFSINDERRPLDETMNVCNYVFEPHSQELILKSQLIRPENPVEDRKQNFTKQMVVSLIVQDSGIGIPLKDQSSLFKLFGKLSSNHNRNKTGCGLGLTIWRKILQKLGGDISLTSRENIGTKLKWTFNCMV
jgi:signal transduction histidine kinase